MFIGVKLPDDWFYYFSQLANRKNQVYIIRLNFQIVRLIKNLSIKLRGYFSVFVIVEVFQAIVKETLIKALSCHARLPMKPDEGNSFFP